MAKRIAKTYWKIWTFFLLFAIAIAGAVTFMPAEKVHAYVPPSNGTGKFFGSLYVDIKYADGDPGTKAEFQVESNWTEADPHAERRSNPEYAIPKSDISSLGGSGGSLGIDYLDNQGWGSAFGFAGENEATITLTEVVPPSDGYDSKSPITIKYRYDNIEDPGNYHTSDYFDETFYYGLDVKVMAGDATLTSQDVLYNSDDYSMTYSYAPVEHTITITYTKDSPQTPTGNLSVTKQLDGNAVDSTKPFNFEVELKDAAGTPLANKTYGGLTTDGQGKLNFDLKGGDTKTITGLPEDATYTVIEDDYSGEGYTTTKTGDVGTIVKDETKTATFTNARNTFGNLEITKKLAGNNPDTTKLFNFEVELKDAAGTALANKTYGDLTTNGEGKLNFELKGNETQTVTGLPNGTTYTVTETSSGSDGYEAVVWTDEAGGTIEGNPTGTIVGGYPDNSTVSYTATNTKNSYGDLTVTKTVVDPNPNHTGTVSNFDFTVELSDKTINGAYGGMTFTDGVAEFSLADSQTAEAKGLPYGTRYEVTEKSYTSAGYVTTSQGASGTIPANGTAQASFTNTRAPKSSLTITKTIDGNDVDPNDEFTFTIELDRSLSGTYDGMTFEQDEITITPVTFEQGKATIKLKGGQGTTIEGLHHGTGYEVTETDAKGYDSSHNGNTGTIHEDRPAAVAFTNTKNSYGDLTVIKTVVDPNPDHQGSLRSFGFVITLDDDTINGIYGDMEFTDGVAGFLLDANEQKTITSLPYGTRYEVVEDSYEHEGYVTTSEGASGTIPADGIAQASFTNTRVPKGSLTIAKTIDGNDVDPNDEFTFTIELDEPLSGTYDGVTFEQDERTPKPVTFEQGKATIKLKGGQGTTIEGLPHGTGYTVTETNPLDYVSFPPYNSGGKGTIDEDKPAIESFLNIREKYGDLTVRKVLAGSAFEEEKDKIFSFTLQLTDADGNPYWNEFGTDYTDETGQLRFDLKQGEQKTFTGIPKGIRYTIIEDSYVADGFDPVVWTDEAGSTIEGNPTGTIEGGYPENSSVSYTATNTKNKAPQPQPQPQPQPGPEPKPQPNPDPDPEPDPVDPEPVIIDPPLQKIITGDDPTNPGTFTFLMKAVSNTAGYSVATMPMPEGAVDGVARHTVTGPGSYEFGEYLITKPGQYIYELSEENTAEAGYSYDTTRYRIEWEITEVDNALVAEKTITDNDGNILETCTFSNEYKNPVSPKPSPTPAPTSKTTTSKTTPVPSRGTVNTGDDLPLGVSIAMLLIAGTVLSLATRRLHTKS